MPPSVSGSHSTSILLAPSASFKKEVFKSVLAIIGFIFVYIILFVLSLGLVAASIYGGVALMLTFSWIALLIGGGLIGLGVMVFVFLVKFLFATSQVDESDSIEITQNDQPELVAFIYQIAEETKTPKPKKIFLSSDVNACVFYHSSFWSMFFPVKKNLKIGLGLINAISKSELKAVIAHEFGHFSQRSMKLGSYTYHVNKIIHDMLYNNSGYGETLNSWSQIHGVFHLFALITLQVVKAIQWVLLQSYKVVNKSYLGLSRQMEFHADLVAASVSGSNNIISALYRIELADACYMAALDVGDKIWKEDKMIGDIYAGQSTVLKRVAHLNKWPMQNGLAIINESHRVGAMNRVTFKNQWASHPTTQERKEYLDQFELQSASDDAPAWLLLKDQQDLRVELTKKLYRNLPIDEKKEIMDADTFELIYNTQVQYAAYPEVYKGYYDNRAIAVFDTNPNQQSGINHTCLEDVLTPATIALPRQLEAMTQDVEMLKAIAGKQVDVSTFDFNGQKYKRQQAGTIQQTIEQELKEGNEKLAAVDRQLYQLGYRMSPLAEAEGLRKKYEHYFANRKQAEDFCNIVNTLMQSMQPIYAGHTLPLEEIKTLINKLKNNDEPQLGAALRYWLSIDAFNGDAPVKKKIEAFLQTDYQYFSGNSFFDTELLALNEVVQESWNGVDRFLVTQFKEVLEHQAYCLGLLQDKVELGDANKHLTQYSVGNR
ncbi:MAG TPA: M48 family metalloprotease [Flavisolibacter sp.]|nr:M48 family metalloprotease [Flavisolibacter sp.]